MGISGNIDAVIQLKSTKETNVIGEKILDWVDAVQFRGWLDLAGGDSRYDSYHAKVQESTHIFLCDFYAGSSASDIWIWNPYMLNTGIKNRDSEEILLTSEMCRMSISGTVYDIMLVDDPMNMHRQLEFYLKYVGGDNGVNQI